MRFEELVEGALGKNYLVEKEINYFLGKQCWQETSKLRNTNRIVIGDGSFQHQQATPNLSTIKNLLPSTSMIVHDEALHCGMKMFVPTIDNFLISFLSVETPFPVNAIR